MRATLISCGSNLNVSFPCLMFLVAARNGHSLGKPEIQIFWIFGLDFRITDWILDWRLDFVPRIFGCPEIRNFIILYLVHHPYTNSNKFNTLPIRYYLIYSILITKLLLEYFLIGHGFTIATSCRP